MSSLLQSLDMSLDDLIAKTKSEPHGARGGRSGRKHSSGPVRRNSNRGSRSNSAPYTRKPRRNDTFEMSDNNGRATVTGRSLNRNRGQLKKASILSRLGDKDSQINGTKLTVSNLKYDILEDDVTELFQTIGEVNKVEISYDRTGRSTGTASVWFVKRSDADKAVRQYNGRTLDGQPMKIGYEDNKGHLNGNKRGGLFGSALKDVQDDEEPTFQVHLGGHRRGGRGGNRMGRGRGRGRRNDGNDRFTSKSAGELDDEMDTYMNQ